MSTVTNVILTFGLSDWDKVKPINAFFGEDGVPLVDVGELTLGRPGKALEAIVLVGAQNCLEHDAFNRHLRGIEWREREEVHLFVQKQDDEAGFHEVSLYLPPPLMLADVKRAVDELRKLDGREPGEDFILLRPDVDLMIDQFISLIETSQEAKAKQLIGRWLVKLAAEIPAAVLGRIKVVVASCPFGVHDGKLIRHRSTLETSMVEWVLSLYALRDSLINPEGPT